MGNNRPNKGSDVQPDVKTHEEISASIPSSPWKQCNKEVSSLPTKVKSRQTQTNPFSEGQQSSFVAFDYKYSSRLMALAGTNYDSTNTSDEDVPLAMAPLATEIKTFRESATPPVARRREHLTPYHMRYLERKYKHCSKPQECEIHGVAKALHVGEEQIRTWFRNRRSEDFLTEESNDGYEFSERLHSLARAHNGSLTCRSAVGWARHAHCCHCVQSFECFWPSTNMQTIRMRHDEDFN
ncbi:predicted protein [Nematostella vectensis]|uniref:Homeobox domain-containing protein n=1 Tax=Nematostella vectensis TaxID=45351 RepID=A7SPI7_NEMVE|nr:uncharacterized protein LOC5505706 isoform X2 [Nematostella vectensis]EDO34373.1 predicted protein [Nematostella vectensis]|eukprot:XP_001626473.1 predicted protein [Nematostella vectensis]